VIVNTALPVFVNVTVCAALAVPTVWLLNVSDAGVTLAAGAGALTPVPARLTVCGLPEALSVIVSIPAYPAAPLGLNVTLIVQLPPALSTLPQLLLSAKLVILLLTELIVSVAPPVFVNVTVCAALVVPTVWLLNVSDAGVTIAVGVAGLAPVPVRLTICGLPEALSATLTLPVLVPAAVGVKVTLIVQFPPAANKLPQLFVSP
jgi:hypothetical protein